MKTIPVMEMRRHLGAIIDEVHLKSETIIIERAGKPVATLSPVDLLEYPTEKTERKLRAVREMAGLYAASPCSKNLDKWLDDERGDWEDNQV